MIWPKSTNSGSFYVRLFLFCILIILKINNIHTNNHFICIYEFHLNYINWVASWTWNIRYNNLNSANCSQGRNTMKIIISTVYYTTFRMFLSLSTRLSFIKTRHNQSSFSVISLNLCYQNLNFKKKQDSMLKTEF